MRGLVGLIQWLSTSAVLIAAISWIAVGHPGTTTTFLWGAQDMLVSGAERLADLDVDISTETDLIRQKEDDLADEIEQKNSPFDTIRERRPLGEFSPGNDW